MKFKGLDFEQGSEINRRLHSNHREFGARRPHSVAVNCFQKAVHFFLRRHNSFRKRIDPRRLTMVAMARGGLPGRWDFERYHDFLTI